MPRWCAYGLYQKKTGSADMDSTRNVTNFQLQSLRFTCFSKGTILLSGSCARRTTLAERRVQTLWNRRSSLEHSDFRHEFGKIW